MEKGMVYCPSPSGTEPGLELSFPDSLGFIPQMPRGHLAFFAASRVVVQP